MSKVILITGCSTGIGRALAEESCAMGLTTFATARDPESIQDLQAETLALDVTSDTSISNAVSRVMAKAGRIDYLVNNAGFNQMGPLAEIPLDVFRQLLETNTVGTLAVSQAVIPHMAKQGSGCIINMGSIVGVATTPFAGTYCATKSAVHALSEVLRMEVAPLGLSVVVVQPGAVRSCIGEKAATGIERFASDDSLYKNVHDGLKKRAVSSQKKPMEAKVFARKLLKAVIGKKKPPRIYRAGGSVGILLLLKKFPPKIYDTIMSRQFGLTKLERSS